MGDEEVKSLWLIWGLSAPGIPVLLACDLSQSVADRHRRALKDDPRWIRIYVEQTRTNHLYGDSLTEIIFNAQQMKRVEERRDA